MATTCHTRTLYLDCFSGISGDMFLGALIDLGVPPEVIQSSLDSLNLEEHLHLQTQRLLRGQVSGIKVDFHFHSHDHSQPHEHHHHSHDSHHGRSYSEIKKLLEESLLDPWIKKHALSIFQRIGTVEAKIHDKTIEEIHFHEVGALDSIADIVGACAALHYLQVETVLCSPLVEGCGTIHCAHGTFPLPAPATLALLAGTGAPLKQVDLPFELITPTGAAILAEFASSFGLLENFITEKVAWGLGTRELPDRPNALRILSGRIAQAPAQTDYETDRVAVLETTLDDITGEAMGYLMELLFQNGAYDVSYCPVTMKKSRPGWQLQVLAPLEHRHELIDTVLNHSSAFGLRCTETPRYKLSKTLQLVETCYGNVTVKIGMKGEKVIKAIPEFEDCKRLAEANQLPLTKVFQAAQEAYNAAVGR